MPAMDDEKDMGAKPKKKSKTLLIIIILIVVLFALGGAAAAYFLFLAKPDAAADAVPVEMTQEMAEPVATAAPRATSDAGVMFDFPTFVVNLSDPAGQRYLKVALSAEMSPKDKKLPEEITAKLPRIKDIVITVLSSKSFDEITTAQGKISLKQELIRRINSVLANGKLRDIYFTEFVVQ